MDPLKSPNNKYEGSNGTCSGIVLGEVVEAIKNYSAGYGTRHPVDASVSGSCLAENPMGYCWNCCTTGHDVFI
jgi:hypothetical protein